MSDNPVHEWLLRCAKEAGSPEKLALEANQMVCDNSRRLLLSFSEHWRNTLRLRIWSEKGRII